MIDFCVHFSKDLINLTEQVQLFLLFRVYENLSEQEATFQYKSEGFLNNTFLEAPVQYLITNLKTLSAFDCYFSGNIFILSKSYFVLTPLSSANSLIVIYFSSFIVLTFITLDSGNGNCFRVYLYHSDTL